jgi:hypothetical protein
MPHIHAGKRKPPLQEVGGGCQRIEVAEIRWPHPSLGSWQHPRRSVELVADEAGAAEPIVTAAVRCLAGRAQPGGVRVGMAGASTLQLGSACTIGPDVSRGDGDALAPSAAMAGIAYRAVPQAFAGFGKGGGHAGTPVPSASSGQGTGSIRGQSSMAAPFVPVVPLSGVGKYRCHASVKSTAK